MNAMVLDGPGKSLRWTGIETPQPAQGQVLLEVLACGVCRTDLHIVDGELPDAKLRLVPGHQIVGRIVQTSPGAERFKVGDRVGVPWLGWTCGTCRFCAGGRENLCERACFTSYTLDGGFAEYAVADERYCFTLPPEYSDVAVAPLLCAGLIGHRALAMAGEGEPVGLYGFGASAHLVAQMLNWHNRQFYAFMRPGDNKGQQFAKSLGATWAGGSTAAPPRKMAAALIFAPVGELVTTALSHLDRGGTVVCAGIHMSDIPAFPYANLWEERCIRSVANLTRQDGEAFLSLAPKVPVTSTTTTYPLADANRALDDLRHGRFKGAAVLVP